MRWVSTGKSDSPVAGERRTAAPSARDLLRWVYVVRVILAIVVFLAAAFYFQAVPPATLVILAVAAICSVLVSGWAAWHTHIRDSRPGLLFVYSQALFDLALVTTVVHVTGGPDSRFLALYIVVIAVSAMLMPLGSSLMVTALASLLYISDIIWWQQEPLNAAVWLQIAVFVGVFIATGWIGSRVQAVGAEREELQQEVHRLRLEASDILGSIHSGVVTVDGAGRLIYVNAAARSLLDIDPVDSPEPSAADVLGRRSRKLWDVILETQRRGAKSLRAEGTVSWGEREFPIGMTTTALDLDAEGPCTVAAIFTDISNQKRLEELRLRTERLEAVAELSASLAHEIKNPLASIRSSVEQLSASTRADDDERSLARLVLRESDRLSGLLTEFLDFSRVRATNCRLLDLVSVVEGALAVVRENPVCSQDTVFDLVGSSVPLEGDADLLHRVVVNLVLNAVQASDGKVSVSIEVREARSEEIPGGFPLGGAVVLRVSDNGPGIPADLRDRVFEPFVTGRIGGSGLGLAIVQRAVQAHRGMVFVDTDPGSQTTLTVFLPIKGASEVIA